jgi:excinuclease ABC subunit C
MSNEPTPAEADCADLTADRTRASVTGPQAIHAYLKRLPGSPGVYRMMDADGNVLYVGKARNLKARVTSYARIGGHTNRIARMIAATTSMEFVVTRTESEALLLEANFIKRFRPRFNVLMRDDKSFPYILIARDHEAPQILKHRGARSRKGDYFGPFASAGSVSDTINTLQRAFLLRSCSDSVYESRTRPCLLHQIKRCSAPCTGEIGLSAYGVLVDEAVRFLRGESQSVRKQLQQLMNEASERLEFERAAEFRNRLRAVSHVTADQAVNLEGVEEADVFAAYQEGGQTCIQVFFFRAGQNWGNRPYFPRADRALAIEDVLDSFIAQFYDDKPVARLILISHDVTNRKLLAEALSTKAERKVDILAPQRGGKRAILDHALRNAREALGRRLAESSSQKRLLQGLAETFGLPAPPRRIEVFDNSHIQGTNAVGAMIVAGVQGMVKSQYRKFNIKSESLAPGDDYGMMREVLTRRFQRLLKGAGKDAAPQELAELEELPPPAEAEQSRIVDGAPLPIKERGADAIAFGVVRAHSEIGEPIDDLGTEELAPDVDDTVVPAWPDIILIDGGPGQLKIAHDVLDALGVTTVAVVGVAKGPDRDAGREHFHVRGRPPFMLEARDPVLYFVQRLRDEAHRFVIGSHRQKRSKAIGANPLDEIVGIGPKRRRMLLNHFGSAKAVGRASVADLQEVEGISAAMAQAIYDFFHENRK